MDRVDGMDGVGKTRGFRMFRKSMFSFLVAAAAVTAARAEEAFDAEKTKALFAGSEWITRWSGWDCTYTFQADGKLLRKERGYGDKEGTDIWKPIGANRVSGDKNEFVMSPDKKELYVRDPVSGASAFYRGKSMPKEFPFLRETLAKLGIVWVQQGRQDRRTIAFNGELEATFGIDGEEKGTTGGAEVFGGAGFCLRKGWGDGFYYLVQDEKGERFLRMNKDIFKSEPAQPGDPLAPQKMARARSQFGGTTWCRMDGKGKVHLLTFNASGTVSDSGFPSEKPEWDPYDNGSVRYKVKDGKRRLKHDADKKILMREDGKVREVWFTGRVPPRMSMTETKQLKDMFGDKSKAWVCWDDGKKTVYTFDDKTANVGITVDDGKPQVVRWEALCAGCIRIGDEAFMVEGETLERVEPRLTLKRVPKDSL